MTKAILVCKLNKSINQYISATVLWYNFNYIALLSLGTLNRLDSLSSPRPWHVCLFCIMIGFSSVICQEIVFPVLSHINFLTISSTLFCMNQITIIWSFISTIWLNLLSHSSHLKISHVNKCISSFSKSFPTNSHNPHSY